MHELLPYVNIFLPNIEELKNLTAQSSIEKAITSIQKLSLTIVVKNGNTGAMLRNHQEVLDQPSFLNTDVIDAIGHVPPEPMRRIEEAIRRYRGDSTH